MKVVIDTNVLVSSFLGTGAPREIINYWKAGEITICLTQEILDEYIKVLERLGVSTEPELTEILKLFASGYYVEYRSVVAAVQVIKEDPADNKFIAAAVAMGARYVISGDRHLKNLGNYMRIECVSPRLFIEMNKMK